MCLALKIRSRATFKQNACCTAVSSAWIFLALLISHTFENILNFFLNCHLQRVSKLVAPCTPTEMSLFSMTFNKAALPAELKRV